MSAQTRASDEPTIQSRQLDGACPACGADRLWQVTKAVDEYRIVEAPNGDDLVQARVEYRECRGCDWRAGS